MQLTETYNIIERKKCIRQEKVRKGEKERGRGTLRTSGGEAVSAGVVEIALKGSHSAPS